jgi:NH3-dependent NAD+ synthetase
VKRDGLPKFSRKGKKLIKENLINKYDQILSDRLSQILRIQIRLSDNTFYEPLSEHAAKSVYRKIVESAANHLSDVGFKSVVVPASGGADSTFVLKILRDASDLLKNANRPYPHIVGFTLPCSLQEDSDHLNNMGIWACELYADDFASVNLGPVHDQVIQNLFESTITMHSGKTLSGLAEEINPNYAVKEEKVDKGNVAARLRMLFSYGIAKRMAGAQCSTDNLSEGLTGFWTLCGDEGTFKYIQSIWKGIEQPMLMKVAGVPSPFICQVETDGLGISSGDCEQLYGHLYTGNETYIDVDTVLINFLSNKKYPDPLNPDVLGKDHPVVRRHLSTEFKRHPFTLTRSDLGLPSIPSLKFAN